MILIDALYVNGGGGKVLLDYLITELGSRDVEVLILMDKRIESDPFYAGLKNRVIFMEAGLRNRKEFYKARENEFNAVLCFGNLPPLRKMNAKVYTYFHQLLYLKIPENFSLKNKFLYNLKALILRTLRKNTDFWLVQSDLIKSQFQKKYKVSNVKVLPFYPPLKNEGETIRIKNAYLYVSNATPHKNHKNLIDAFCQFFDQKQTGKLILTVSENYPETVELINQKIGQGYPIENIGFVNRDQLAKVYRSAEFLIFPSLAESFGLGLVEAINLGCRVIAADLPYTHAVCEPSLTFNPLQVESIVEALLLSLHKDVKPAVNKVPNQIDELIALLQ
ncbi:glycosyltransferase [Chryseobacterium sp. R2A-55]|uniref:glycosyltransferase n=1 Tax=Chryseobacterium sp. R2A-55 TaxID=2744445 RepID=UPI001F332B1F|nr:glycosyltransferase [Chryseobacterium sp. R2A-55]